MNRRDFLRSASVASLLPLAVGQAFAGEDGVHDHLVALTAAWRTARQSNRALLVITVPSDREERYLRGGAWGEGLTWGGERVLALLGQVEVIAVRQAALESLVPQARDTTAWGWFIDPSALPLKLGRVGVTWEEPEPMARREAIVEDDERCWDLAPEPARACYESRALRIAEREIAESDARVGPFGEALERAARGIVRPLHTLDSVSRSRLTAAGKRWLTGGFAGAGWETAGGCGSTPDTDDDDARIYMLCGMGYVPAHSTRFLNFLIPWNEGG